MPSRAVLFDFDGTLADTAPDLAAAVNRMRAEEGHEPLPLERLRPFASAGARPSCSAACSMGAACGLWCGVVSPQVTQSGASSSAATIASVKRVALLVTMPQRRSRARSSRISSATPGNSFVWWHTRSA